MDADSASNEGLWIAAIKGNNTFGPQQKSEYDYTLLVVGGPRPSYRRRKKQTIGFVDGVHGKSVLAEIDGVWMIWRPL